MNDTKNINSLHDSSLRKAERLVVLGAGESGVGAALLAKKYGYEVFVSDSGSIPVHYKKELQDNKIDFEEGRHSEEKILSAAEVMKSPGIPDKAELIQKIRAKKIPIISEIELAYRHKGNSKIVAITGTNGKSTTTSLIYHICKTAGLDCALVGNIGYSFAKQIAESPKSLYIAEISSFQLDDIKNFRPDIALLLNITEDHLDRYHYNMEEYVTSKFKIIENQTASDFFIYSLDDEVISEHLKNISFLSTPLPFSMKQEVLKGAYIRDNQIMIRAQEEHISMNVYDFVTLKGKHNQYNTMAAGIAASVLDIRKEKIREAVQTFKSLEHRMEFVMTIRGVDFINDSKGTNLNSVWYALESMTKPVILILGGIDKGNDYSLIEDLVKEKVKAIVCLGIDNKKIHAAFEKIIPAMIDTKSMKGAVQAAFSLSGKGDVVLLSPGCSSFDLFEDYMDRGTQFKEQVKEL